MRRVLILVLAISLVLTGCSSQVVRTVKPLAEREDLAFDEWDIPSYFIPRQIRVVGLGDSLTQGVGDEKKMGGYFGRVTADMLDWKGVLDIDADNLAKRGRRSDQLIEQLNDEEIQSELRKADVIFLTIGGNDIMKVVKANLFKLRVDPFYKEMDKFESKLDEIFGILRALNSDAIIVMAGLYNPITNVTNEASEFEDIINDWNEVIQFRTMVDSKSCYVPVVDLFASNENMVYHSDFFHPNSKGYDQMSNRFLIRLDECGLHELSDGELDM